MFLITEQQKLENFWEIVSEIWSCFHGNWENQQRTAPVIRSALMATTTTTKTRSSFWTDISRHSKYVSPSLYLVCTWGRVCERLFRTPPFTDYGGFPPIPLLYTISNAGENEILQTFHFSTRMFVTDEWNEMFPQNWLLSFDDKKKISLERKFKQISINFSWKNFSSKQFFITDMKISGALQF